MAYVIGIDFGTDSVRSVLAEVATGNEIATSVFEYPRWKKGLYSDPSANRFRQHPLDYLEGVEYVICNLLTQFPEAKDKVLSIALDTTGSTPCLVNKEGTPLALLNAYKENPNAMFVLWKDHTAIQEAAEINSLCRQWETDYTAYSGRNYSSEWYWAKALHLIREDQTLEKEAYAVLEHCDWMVSELTGVRRVEDVKISRCSAGHKAMWAEQWNGFPSAGFLSALHPVLADFVSRLNPETYACDQPAGILSPEWAKKLGLPETVVVGIGNTDAHTGAVGAGVKYQHLVLNVGTSTCCMIVMPSDQVGDTLIEGISGQVDGSIIPGMIGFEAGMSAFGDVYAWFRQMISSPIREIIQSSSLLDEKTRTALIQEVEDRIFHQLTTGARQIVWREDSVSATDWLNGRRNPFINYSLKGSMEGLTLSTGAPEIYYALVEATAFGVKAIVDHFLAHGIEIREVIATGGIAQKSPFVMQVLSDVLNMPIFVPDTKQACALGAAMFAATVAGCYPTVEEAQSVFMKKTGNVYTPDYTKYLLYRKRYERYRELGS